MKYWLKVSLLLCIFGFLKEIRPSEPFVYEFLIGPWRNISEEVISQEVYPIGTYSYLAQLVLLFLVTDLCRYKPLIIILGISGIVIWSLLLWTQSLLCLQIVEILYGTFMATEVAYYTYIYAKVDKEYFQQVTSHTRAAILAGRASSGILAQVLISFHWMNYRELNYITFAAMICATLWSFLLPSGKKSVYFHPEDLEKSSVEKCSLSSAEVKPSPSREKAFTLMKTHFLNSFSDKYVIKWSLWWALSTCGFIQVQTYMQLLWAEIQGDKEKPLYNGLTEAALTILGFCGALIAGVLKIDWHSKGELFSGICSFIAGALLIIGSHTDCIIVSYICYVIFGSLYHFMITISSSEIAKHIDEDSYGLVFSFNTFIGLLLQSLLTVIIVTKNLGFGLAPRDQYLLYGLYHMIVACFYVVMKIINCLVEKRGVI